MKFNWILFNKTKYSLNLYFILLLNHISRLKKLNRRRVYLIVLIILISIFLASSSIPVNQFEAKQILDDFEEIILGDPTTFMIFENNMGIALLMMVPVLGLIIGPYALYNTGLIFSASGVVSGFPSILMVLIIFIMPFFWLEFLSYAAAITQGSFLIWAIKKKKLRIELRNTLRVIGIVAILLFVGAWIEEIFIQL